MPGLRNQTFNNRTVKIIGIPSFQVESPDGGCNFCISPDYQHLLQQDGIRVVLGPYISTQTQRDPAKEKEDG